MKTVGVMFVAILWIVFLAFTGAIWIAYGAMGGLLNEFWMIAIIVIILFISIAVKVIYEHKRNSTCLAIIQIILNAERDVLTTRGWKKEYRSIDFGSDPSLSFIYHHENMGLTLEFGLLGNNAYFDLHDVSGIRKGENCFSFSGPAADFCQLYFDEGCADYREWAKHKDHNYDWFFFSPYSIFVPAELPEGHWDSGYVRKEYKKMARLSVEKRYSYY